MSTTQVNAYAPLKVEVSTNDPEELDEKGRQKPDSMDVQVKVTEQVLSQSQHPEKYLKVLGVSEGHVSIEHSEWTLRVL